MLDQNVKQVKRKRKRSEDFDVRALKFTARIALIALLATIVVFVFVDGYNHCWNAIAELRTTRSVGSEKQSVPNGTEDPSKAIDKGLQADVR
jgi:hypothetical protein